MNSTDLARVIETVGKERGIKREIIIEALEQAVLSAAQKKYGPHAVLESHYNPESGEIDLFLFKKVVDSDDAMLEENEEIKFEDAKKLDQGAELGDEIGIKLDDKEFGRIDAQSAKQVIFQKVRDAERDIIFNEYVHRKGEIITGIARRVERGNLVIDLGKTDALLPRNEVIPGEQFKPGDRVQAYLSEVAMTPKGPQIYLSRTSPKYLEKLFETEVPEIRDGLIEIKASAREPGSRAKIAVISKDRDVDPVGACVGMKGVRVNAVIQELKGERIDIIQWTDNSVLFVQKALAPAEISSINVNEKTKTMEIMVEDEQLSKAIGKRGQNVRLAAFLTGWKLDIISKTKLQKRQQEAVFNLQHIEGLNETLAQGIYQSGYVSVRQVADAKVEDLQKIPGYDSEEAAKRLKNSAMSVIEKSGDLLAGDATANEAKESFIANPNSGVGNSGDAKSMAEERLKKMMSDSSDASDKNNA